MWETGDRLFPGWKVSWGHNDSYFTDSPLNFQRTLMDRPQPGLSVALELPYHIAINGPERCLGHVLWDVNSTTQEALGVL